MIECKVKVRSKRAYVSVSGHARAAPKGEDIICAAASILVLTLISALGEYGARDFRYRLSDGNAEVKFKLDKATKHLYNSFICGFNILHEMYPQYISISN